MYLCVMHSITVKITLVSKELESVIRNITCSNRPDRVATLAEQWASIPKVVGLIPPWSGMFFQLARCGSDIIFIDILHRLCNSIW